MAKALDVTNLFILAKKVEAREKIKTPRIGDFIFMLDGSLRRFTHDWRDSMQVTPPNTCGSFFLGSSGGAEYSGSLDPAIDKNKIKEIPCQEMNGRFWFFHRDIPAAHSDVYADIVCRVYRQIK